MNKAMLSKKWDDNCYGEHVVERNVIVLLFQPIINFSS